MIVVYEFVGIVYDCVFGYILSQHVTVLQNKNYDTFEDLKWEQIKEQIWEVWEYPLPKMIAIKSFIFFLEQRSWIGVTL